MADEDATGAVLMSILRSAISDPGRVVARQGVAGVWEPMPLWQARAVAAAMTEAGLSAIATAERDKLATEVERLKKLVTLLQNSGDRIGFAVVTYNQASHWPEFDYADLHTDLDDAVNERDHKRQETASIGRGELHVIAEVTELKEHDDA